MKNDRTLYRESVRPWSAYRVLRVAVFLLLLTLPAVSSAASDASRPVRAAAQLARRVVPSIADSLRFEYLPAAGGSDCFELEQAGPFVTIRGNSANSMAVGLNHYLKYYCLTSVSWYKDDPVQLPAAMPVVPRKVRVDVRVAKRFFLNYCTFGYTMTWWQWPDWERLIDWMALQGINQPLAITGQEAVWYNVWRKLGLPDKEIRDYFTGPAHLPWHRMTNLDRFQGGLPDSWLTHQADLQRRIVERERQLGMTPVLPAFAGHVPEAIRTKYPDARITKMSSWGGFRDYYRSFFLDPMDPLFARIQKLFLDEQTRLYGTDHIYGIDPFNEIESPSWEPEYLARVGRTIYSTLTQCDPKATWLQMTWLFYFDRGHWTNERIDAYVNSVPRGRMLLLDYFAENTEVWKTTESYFGQPYLWCYLGNFGGNTMLAGNLAETGRRIENVMARGGANFSGLGSTLEALDVNPLMYEYVFEKAWNGTLTDEAWMEAWADRRLGRCDTLARAAWTEMLRKVYTSTARLGQGTLTNARPSLTGHGNWTTNPSYNYSNADLFRCWEQLLAAAEASGPLRDSQLFDMVNVGRQVLGNHFQALRDRFADAYNRRDELSLGRYGRRMTALLSDLERLLSCHSTFLFGRWTAAARQFGHTPAEQAYYEKNARTLLTTWGERGQSLNDYANRSWAGLTAGYYKPRWETFVDDVCRAVAEGRKFDAADFNRRVMDMEQAFSDYPSAAAATTRADGLDVVRTLVGKYRTEILAQ